MKKMFRRTAAIAISAFMAAQYIPFTAVAVTGGTQQIIIHSYQLSAAEYATASGNPATGIKASDEATLANYNSRAVRGDMTYKIYGTTSSAGKYSPDKANLITTVVTDSTTGIGTSEMLLPGVYWIDPIDNDNTNPEFADADAFFIELPNASNPLNIYPKTTDNDYDNQSSDNGKLHTIEFTKTNSSGSALAGVNFKVYFKNANGDWESAKTTTGEEKTYTTDSNGKITIAGLPIGDYYFVEQSLGTNTGYLLDQTPQKVTITGTKVGETAVPVAYSFANEDELKVGKVISADGAGHTYNWKITADLPENRANLLSYVITDTFKGVDIIDASTAITGLAKGTDFTTAFGTGTDADKYTITITSAGLDKIKDSSNTDFNTATALNITIASSLDTTDLDTNDNAVNKASISYQYAYNPDPTDPSTPDIPGIIDPDDPNNNPSYPSVNNYPPADPTVPAPSDPSDPTTPVDVIKPCKFYISNKDSNGTELINGAYEIPNGSMHYDITDTSDSNFKLAEITDLAPGPYTIEQKGTQSGYQVDTTIKNIYISKDGNIYEYDPTAAEGSRIGAQITNNTVIFTNAAATSNFNLPFTGTTATIVFSITGILLMAGTAFFIFIILKKRDDDEEEQENN